MDKGICNLQDARQLIDASPENSPPSLDKSSLVTLSISPGSEPERKSAGGAVVKQ